MDQTTPTKQKTKMGGKTMRTHFTNVELPHIWIRQLQNDGKANSMFFEGRTIFSYGKHFPIANILNNGTILFTAQECSSTTAHHKNCVRNAISDAKILFTVPEVWSGLGDADINHAKNAKYLERQFIDLKGRAFRASIHSNAYAKHANIAADSLGKYCRIFAKQIPLELRRKAAKIAACPFTSAEIETLTKKGIAAQVRMEAAEKRRETEAAERAKQQIPNLEKWATNDGPYYHGFQSLPVRLRVVYDSEKMARIVETSHGAKVDFHAAVVMLGLWQAGTLENGATISGYTVREIAADHLLIGCHRIEREEAERVITAASQN